jgi:hypothetical protein
MLLAPKMRQVMLVSLTKRTLFHMGVLVAILELVLVVSHLVE